MNPRLSILKFDLRQFFTSRTTWLQLVVFHSVLLFSARGQVAEMSQAELAASHFWENYSSVTMLCTMFVFNFISFEHIVTRFRALNMAETVLAAPIQIRQLILTKALACFCLNIANAGIQLALLKYCTGDKFAPCLGMAAGAATLHLGLLLLISYVAMQTRHYLSVNRIAFFTAMFLMPIFAFLSSSIHIELKPVLFAAGLICCAVMLSKIWNRSTTEKVFL